MSITKQTLLMKMLYLPSALIVLSTVLVILFVPEMYISGPQYVYFNLIPIAIVIASVICFFSAIARIYYGKALIKKNIDIELIRGTVTRMKKTRFAPKVYIDGKKYTGQIVTMDEIKYYIFIDEKLEYNAQIWVNVIRGSRLVVEWGFYSKPQKDYENLPI
ncbi:hypothetical protein BK010_00535 [Tenericutes bacterium MO-XQ]|nr:hypothetical protein BK010_00535 [Tenericutes bacterium MO-XQ]